MHSSKLLKICKIESTNFAKYCLNRGADFLGVHVIQFSLDPDVRTVCEYIADQGGKAVLLTKERSLPKLHQMVDFYKPWGLQLHYPLSPEEYSELCTELSIPVVPVVTDEIPLQKVIALIAQAPFSIYDTSFRGGTGVSHSQKHLAHIPVELLEKVLLAGGMTPESIPAQNKVGGYDVQSYVRPGGRHHYGRAEQIFNSVKGFPRRQLSISLTDVVERQTLPPYTRIQALEYQLDYSIGTLYKGFNVDSAKLEAILLENDAPFTLHIFETTVLRFQSVIDHYTQLAGNKLVRINLQYSPELEVDDISTYDARLCVSVYYKDFEAYNRRYPQPHSCLSLILPTELAAKKDTMHTHASFLTKLKTTECWFDRRVDPSTIALVLDMDANANFISGKYVLSDWSREADLIRILRAG